MTGPARNGVDGPSGFAVTEGVKGRPGMWQFQFRSPTSQRVHAGSGNAKGLCRTRQPRGLRRTPITTAGSLSAS